MKLRGWLYMIARLMGDATAVKKGKPGKRLLRRGLGKLAGRSIDKWTPK